MTDPLFHPTHIICAVIRLNFRYNTEAVKSFKVIGVYHLSMNQPKTTILLSISFDHSFHHVQQITIPLITNGMNRKLYTGGVSQHGKIFHITHHLPTAFGGRPWEHYGPPAAPFFRHVGVRFVEPST